MRSYSNERCSGFDGSSRSWLISRVCSSNHSCQQSAHVCVRTRPPHLPGSGAWSRPGLRWPHRRHSTVTLSAGEAYVDRLHVDEVASLYDTLLHQMLEDAPTPPRADL